MGVKEFNIIRRTDGAALSAAVVFLFWFLFSCTLQASSDSSAASTDTFRVALLLPLHTEQLDQLDTVPDQSAQLVSAGIPALHFYEAACLFRDSLASRGLVAEFHVLDMCQDTAAILKQINQLRGSNYDAILSLLPISFQPALTSASNKWKRPVFVFQSSNVGALYKSKWMRLVVPSNNTQIRMTAHKLIDVFPDAEIHTVYRDQRNEREVARLFKSVIDSVSLDTMRCRPFHFKGSWAGLTGKLVAGKRNLIIVPTIDESFLSSFINALDPVRKEYEILLCGMPAWESFESIDPSLLQQLNTILFNGYFIYNRSDAVKEFRKTFVNEFHSDPLPQAYMAWDALVMAFNETVGEDTLQALTQLQQLNIHVELEPVCEECGKENRQVQMLEFFDFELRPFAGEKKE
jgi:hypothetical protein